MKSRVFLVAATVFASISLVGCAATDPVMQPGMVSSDGDFESQQDLMFSVMMIPHHEQAIEMSQLAISKTDSSEIRRLAEEIIAGQTPEIVLMQSWLDESGAFSGMPNMMQSSPMGDSMMGGMATEAEMDELKQLSAEEFDVMFLELMIEHHEGALDMVQMITDSTDAEVRQLATDIIRVQSKEIEQMEQMLGGY